MPVPLSIDQLISRFRDDHDRYRRAAYNETEARVQFINPLFEALGWDMGDAFGRDKIHADIEVLEEQMDGCWIIH